jgi:hypothetical protein
MAARQGTRGTAARVRTSDVVAFRLRAHHLVRRQPASRLDAVVGACGIQDSPPGSVLLALHARLEGVTRDRVDRLVGDEKRLLQTWCMRGAPFCVPTVDAPVFTAGVLPPTEPARVHLVVGVAAALDALRMGLDETVDLIAAEIGAVLSGRQLAIGDLGRELAERVAVGLSPARREIWQAAGPYGANQPLGEAVVHFCLRILALRGTVCFAPRTRNQAPFVLLEEWLGRPLPHADPVAARAALLRRYLHCYGPSTRQDFAAWVGVHPGDADAWWATLADEIVPVDCDGRRAWILADDLAALRSPLDEARGVRLLPPGDPYPQLRDRDTIVDPRRHREVWRPAGAPGTVLAAGTIAGIWRSRKRGRVLTLQVTAFRPLTAELRRQLHDEGDRVASLRGASTAQVEIVDAAP